MRRALYLLAGALTVLSLALPLWSFWMMAPQYPGESLQVRVTRTGLSGDVQEVATLQQYVGVRFPSELPELEWLTPAVLVIAALLALAGVGRGAVGRLLRRAAAGLLLALLAGSLVALQVRLYQVGHDRAPDAPLRSMKNFTPPAVGPVKVGNFTVWSLPHAGGVALAAATGLAVFGLREPKRARQR
jgi:hypothetical protein